MTSGSRTDPGRVSFVNASLRNLILNAYHVRDYQISGPDWLKSERFDVVATLPAGAARRDIPAMMQALLADRFKLAMHKESKVLPVYALVAAKGGPKLQPAEAKSGGMRMAMGPKGYHLIAKMTLETLANSLSNYVDRPVVDMTELKGTFDIDLEFTSENAPGGMRSASSATEARPQDENSLAPNIFTVLQEKLGLKLDPRKAPLDIYVVDHAEKVPTEN